MIRVTLVVAVLSAGACLSLPASAAPAGAVSGIQLAQADVTVKTTEPAVREKVIVHKPAVAHKRVVVGAPACHTVTTKVREGGRTVVKKVKRCP